MSELGTRSATHNFEAEKAVVGSAILSRGAASELATLLKPEDFLRPSHRLMFAAIKRLVASDRAVDLVTLRDELGSDLAEIGGEDYLVQVAEFVPSAANAAHYGAIVQSTSWRRGMRSRLAELLGRFEDSALESGELAAMVRSLADDSHHGLSGCLIPIGDLDVDGECQKGLPTGYGPTIDGFTEGLGWVCGQTNVVSAYHKGGKTTFMAGSFASLAAAGRRVVYATFADLSPKQLKRRILKQLSGAGSYPRTRVGLQPDYLEVLRTIDDAAGPWRNTFFYASDENDGTIETFAGKMLSEHSRKPIEALFVDYAQEIGSREVRAAQGATALLEYVSRQLARLAKRIDAPLIVGSQVTIGPDGKWTTKYARALEEGAGFVLRLVREPGADAARVQCSHNRFGPQNVEAPLRWDDERVRFVPPTRAIQYEPTAPPVATQGALEEEYDPFADE